MEKKRRLPPVGHGLVGVCYRLSQTNTTKLVSFGACVCVLQTGKRPVDDLFTDLSDGRRLLELLEGLCGPELVQTAHTHTHIET